MVGTIREGMEFVWLAIQIQIGQDVSVTGRVLLGVVSNWAQQLCLGVLKIIKKYLGKCFSSPRCLRGEKVPNVDPSHLICERQIKR
jgi:hypothetical protein